ncbi:MAG: hypothetical protein LBK50_00380 [Candidatus Nomurabacteria bacterium]|jgi:hypothetical protein|nr:hypothetical protein [Candidatus Nomurabacteria bacterium]
MATYREVFSKLREKIVSDLREKGVDLDGPDPITKQPPKDMCKLAVVISNAKFDGQPTHPFVTLETVYTKRVDDEGKGLFNGFDDDGNAIAVGGKVVDSLQSGSLATFFIRNRDNEDESVWVNDKEAKETYDVQNSNPDSLTDDQKAKLAKAKSQMDNKNQESAIMVNEVQKLADDHINGLAATDESIQLFKKSGVTIAYLSLNSDEIAVKQWDGLPTGNFNIDYHSGSIVGQSSIVAAVVAPHLIWNDIDIESQM